MTWNIGLKSNTLMLSTDTVIPYAENRLAANVLILVI